jgi:hypothetical protein
MTKFVLIEHSILGHGVVEMWYNGVYIGKIYPSDKFPGCYVLSHYPASAGQVPKENVPPMFKKVAEVMQPIQVVIDPTKPAKPVEIRPPSAPPRI